ncbi:hypothetical protein [Natrarchaeobaculum aegyptiacum]|uniref:DUF2064 domain-containing protein n=1 Tax=Natrarchaeobaculum aegyptiacum TaxID=745377 RepID=A0A2Z2HT39_9EURY|nr:hypothetical protein [Natrarchaeobaculum aegyptiacum]ARS90386.1 hypothetical protein B1756_12055 [Natrarchaeobaculum aegyptiacum]
MIVVVPVDPPRAGLVCPSLVEETRLTPGDAVRLYEGAVKDVCAAAVASGGDLLVNYRDEETLPDANDEEADDDGKSNTNAKAAVCTLVEDALGFDLEGEGENDDDRPIRFERQVGSSRSARIGNTVTHLLEREGADSVAVLDPTASLVGRTEIDSAAMSLRRYDVVLGPSAGGRTYLAGFTEPVDFTDAYARPERELQTLANRAEKAGLQLGLAQSVPTIATESGLCATIATLEARQVAARPGGEATAAVVDELGLSIGGGGTVERR